MTDPYAKTPTACESRVLIEIESRRYRAWCDRCGWRSEDTYPTRFEARCAARRHMEGK